MGVAFRAPRAPIERPERPSSRFSFCRRGKLNYIYKVRYILRRLFNRYSFNPFIPPSEYKNSTIKYYLYITSIITYNYVDSILDLVLTDDLS